jgi:hypothetical protein
MRTEAQNAKRQVQEFQRQLAELQKAKEQPLVDFFQDPDAADAQRLDQRINPLQQRLEERAQKAEFRSSRAEAIAVHGKEAVDRMEQAIGQAMAVDDQEVVQHLRARMLGSDDPFGLGMAWYENRPENQEARILAKYGLGPDGKPIAGSNVAAANGAAGALVMPSNLAGARNVGTRSGPAWAGPIPLDDIFKR